MILFIINYKETLMVDLYKVISQRLRYEDGHLYYKDSDTLAGRVNSKGYIQVYCKGVRLQAHRVVWYMHLGTLPTGDIDHINRVKIDNRIENLRDVDKSTNMLNRGLFKNNKTGYRGITTRGSKFRASVTRHGKQKKLGTFDTAEEANQARTEYLSTIGE